MNSLAEPEIQAHCCARIARLDPHARPRWGRMTAPQIVCHLIDSFSAGAGEKYASPATGFATWRIIKWIALGTSLPWAHNTPTRPEVEQGRGGTPPGDWDRDRAQLCDWIRSFPAREKFGRHPAFGEMSPAEWQIWAYKHVDHHLRQFGV